MTPVLAVVLALAVSAMVAAGVTLLRGAHEQAGGAAASRQSDGEDASASRPGDAPSPGPAPGGGAFPAATAEPSPEVVVLAAGDIACAPGRPTTASECRHDAVARLIEARRPDAVLALGDLQYPDGALADFRASYDATWGRFKDVTRPAPGNHEFHTTGAAGYFDYFGPAAGERGRGYYAYELGGWKLLALNSVCDVVGCGADSEQVRWLRAELAADGHDCALAYLHHPRWTTGRVHAEEAGLEPIMRTLHEHGVELVLAGHDHNYQRFPRLDAAGNPDPAGVRQFVVGTGGARLYAFDDGDRRAEARSRSFGALELRLGDGSYRWEFVADGGGPNGTFSDRGAEACHRRP